MVSGVPWEIYLVLITADEEGLDKALFRYRVGVAAAKRVLLAGGDSPVGVY